MQLICNELGINHNILAPRTPQLNGVVEKKNRTLVDIARNILIDAGITQNFWVKAINIACRVINRCLSRCILDKTPLKS